MFARSTFAANTLLRGRSRDIHGACTDHDALFEQELFEAAISFD
ncbi:hypothetical protein BRPE64_CCDS03030 [Caballeronia insecticola]|uniref:Uncharacterized protein n=1 Tax=Caballeronia insecticola TaxID=758793 RepID=R4X1X0_9BURK|nr:hypothetical protein BRPE64_CCDS03030 [Caballeronia insecticola]